MISCRHDDIALGAVISKLCLDCGQTNTLSRCYYKRDVQLRRRNTSRNGGENMSAELDEKVQATAPCCCVAGAQSAVA